MARHARSHQRQRWTVALLFGSLALPVMVYGGMPTVEAAEAPAQASTSLPNIVYVRGQNIWLREGTSGVSKQLTTSGDIISPDVSPDGTKIAYIAPDPNRATFTRKITWIMNIDGSEARALDPQSSNDQHADYSPEWSPDGKRIAMMRNFDWSKSGTSLRGFYEIFTISSDGSDVRQLTHLGTAANPISTIADPTWSPDGQRLAFAGKSKILTIMDADGANMHPVSNATSGTTAMYEPDWAADGNRIYARTGQTGGIIVYYDSTDAFRTVSQKVQPYKGITSAGGWTDQAPRASLDGSKVVFASDGRCSDACTGSALYTVSASGGKPELIPGTSGGTTPSFAGSAISGPVTATPSPSIPAPSSLKIASLGDSVASGEGTNYRWHYVLDTTKGNGKNGVWNGKWVSDNINPKWEPITDSTPAVQDCHRSTDGYPYKVAVSLNASLLNLACSGASTDNGVLRHQLFGHGIQATKPQLGIAEQLYDPPNADFDAFKPDVVTLTLGADDVDFGDFLGDCYSSAYNHDHLSRFCDTGRKDLNTKADALLKSQKANLDKTIGEILNRGQAMGKQPRIFVTTYYDPFPDTYAKCQDITPIANGLPIVGGAGISSGEMAWLKQRLAQINANIRAVAKKYPQVAVVNLENDFQEHKWCSKDPWFYGASVRLPASQRENPSPFHPAPPAQAAIAAKVSAAILKSLTA